MSSRAESVAKALGPTVAPTEKLRGDTASQAELQDLKEENTRLAVALETLHGYLEAKDREVAQEILKIEEKHVKVITDLTDALPDPLSLKVISSEEYTANKVSPVAYLKVKNGELASRKAELERELEKKTPPKWVEEAWEAANTKRLEADLAYIEDPKSAALQEETSFSKGLFDIHANLQARLAQCISKGDKLGAAQTSSELALTRDVIRRECKPTDQAAFDAEMGRLSEIGAGRLSLFLRNLPEDKRAAIVVELQMASTEEKLRELVGSYPRRPGVPHDTPTGNYMDDMELDTLVEESEEAGPQGPLEIEPLEEGAAMMSAQDGASSFPFLLSLVIKERDRSIRAGTLGAWNRDFSNFGGDPEAFGKLLAKGAPSAKEVGKVGPIIKMGEYLIEEHTRASQGSTLKADLFGVPTSEEILGMLEKPIKDDNNDVCANTPKASEGSLGMKWALAFGPGEGLGDAAGKKLGAKVEKNLPALPLSLLETHPDWDTLRALPDWAKKQFAEFWGVYVEDLWEVLTEEGQVGLIVAAFQHQQRTGSMATGVTSRQTKEDAKMAEPKTTPGTMTTLRNDSEDAAWRTAAKQLTKLVRDPLAALLSRHLGEDSEATRKKIANFLETDMGTTLIMSVLSVGMTVTPVPPAMKPQVERLARELRVGSMERGMDQTADILMGPLRAVLADFIHGGVPAGLDMPELVERSGQAVEGLDVEAPVSHHNQSLAMRCGPDTTCVAQEDL